MTGPLLLTGTDAGLLLQAVQEAVRRLVGDADRSLVLSEFDGDDYLVEEVVDAAQTAPFLTDRRVVVARGLDRFKVEEFAPLVRYLADPLPTTALVLTASGRLPKSLTDALKAAGGEQRAVDPPAQGKARAGWIHDRLASAPVRLDDAARTLVADHVGEDVARLESLFDVLASAYGDGAKLSAAEVEPYLGEGGAVPPWELTDAIDAGDVRTALVKLRRMLDGGGRHPLQLMATLHTHYQRMLRLDGSAARDERSAAEVLGMKGSTFPAKKALAQLQRLGSDGVRRAVLLLADADLDLRGRVDWPGELVLEVLVARLARLAPARRR